MLPVFFRIAVPTGWGVALAAGLAAAIALARALDAWRRARREGRPIGFGSALWDDKLLIAVLVVAVVGLWRSGVLDGELSLPVHSYGLLIATGMVLAVFLALREARRQKQDPERFFDLAFWLLLTGLLGSHVYYALVNAHEYFSADTWLVESPFFQRLIGLVSFGQLDVPRVPRALVPGGIVFYGGIIGATLAGFIYVRRHRMPFLSTADIFIPSVAIAHFFGRLGCFCAGCCWGEVSHAGLSWLVRFPPESLAYQSFAARPDGEQFLTPDRLTTLPLHPVQLYEAFGELALFLFLVFWVRPRKQFEGQILATWLLLYALLRSTVELFRGDIERGVVGGLSVGHWTSMVVFAAGVAVWFVGRARRFQTRPT